MIDFFRLRLQAFGHAIRGIVFLVSSESHAKLHGLATVIVCGAAAMLRVTAGEWCLLLLSIGLVWTAEALNSAIERTVDLCSPDPQELAGRAKDLAAGGVLLAAVTAAVVGLIVLGPRLWGLV